MQFERYVQRRFDQQAHNQSVVRSTQKYDMVAAADESYYAKQYWQRIHAILQTEALSRDSRILDVGCGQGRMSIPLAKWCHHPAQVTAVDLSASAIAQAKNYAAQADVSAIDFQTTDLFAFLKTIPDQTFDIVTMLEVVFFLPNYEQALAEIKRILKPNGLFIGSFRSQYFNILYGLQHGMLNAVDMLLNQRSGAFMGGQTHFNWHTLPELTALLEQTLHFHIKHVSGIGVCSGIPGDPHAHIVRPSALSAAEQQRLMQAEEQCATRLPEAGRYILIAARSGKESL